MSTKKVVLITGASSGMGKETVKLLLREGYTVYGAARRIDKMKDLLESGAHVLSMDVTDEADVQRGVEQIIRQEGRIDILVNNAGFGQFGAVEDMPMSDARYQMEVNLFGLARLTQLVLPHMRRQRYGKVVNITSIGGKMAAPLGGWYHSSKFAVEGLSDSLRLELKPFGVDVIIIEPGGIKTEWQGIAEESMQKFSGHTDYKTLTEKVAAFSRQQRNFADPQIIARLIHKAITARKPKARYVAGTLARPILFLKHWLSDALFDRIIMSQLK